MATSTVKSYETSMHRLSKLSCVKKSTSKIAYIQCEKKYFKIHLILLKMGKCGDKHATSTD